MTQILDLTGNTLLVDGINNTSNSGVTTPVSFQVGQTIDSNVVATTFTANAATGTSYFVKGTTPALVTAAAASQAEVYTLTGVAATDIAFVSLAGGTNTTNGLQLSAVCTTNTVTVTIYNNNVAGTALNGTVIFNLLIMKA